MVCFSHTCLVCSCSRQGVQWWLCHGEAGKMHETLTDAPGAAAAAVKAVTDLVHTSVLAALLTMHGPPRQQLDSRRDTRRVGAIGVGQRVRLGACTSSSSLRQPSHAMCRGCSWHPVL
jgi:hypothetical protein